MNRSTNTPLFGVFRFGFIVMETRTEMWLAVESGRKVSPDFTDMRHDSSLCCSQGESRGWESDTKIWKTPWGETTGSNTNAEPRIHSDDLDLLSPVSVTPAEQQRLLRDCKNKGQVQGTFNSLWTRRLLHNCRFVVCFADHNAAAVWKGNCWICTFHESEAGK